MSAPFQMAEQRRTPLLLPSEDIFSMIAELCTFVDLAVLSRLCRPAARAVYHDRRRRVNVQVAPFVGDRLEELRVVLQINRALLTGSVVLRMLVDNMEITPGGLTIAVPPGMSAAAIVTFVMSLGYDAVPHAENGQRDRIHTGLHSATDWRVGRFTTYIRPCDQRRIEIVRSETPYAMDVVLAHPNTLMQNFATGTSLGCLFPTLTLHGHAMATEPEVPNHVVAEQLSKYKRWGFRIHADNSYLASACGPNCPAVLRLPNSSSVCVQRYWELYGEYDGEGSRSLPPTMRAEHLTQMRPAQEFRASCYCSNLLCVNYNL